MHCLLVRNKNNKIPVMMVASQLVEHVLCLRTSGKGEELIVVSTSSISFWLTRIGDEGGSTNNWAFRTASSSDKFGTFSFTCKYCKYTLGDSTGGYAADTIFNFLLVDSFLVEIATNSIKIGLIVYLDLGRKSKVIRELNLSLHLT